MRLLAFPGASKDSRETDMAMRDERTQSEFAGKGERLTVRSLGVLKSWGIAVREEGTDEA